MPPMAPGSDIPWKAACASAGLALLFLVVYPFCSWVTSFRAGVPSFYFSWERSFPFVPLMIVPYLSIDVFFVLAPFLARTDRALFVYCCRMAAAMLVCAACFLLFPLRCAFEQRHVSGILGNVFDHFREVDLPYNECPSLHIAALVLLADIYLRRLRGMPRGAIVLWFLLIGISPLLVYQHHLVDIAAGLLLGVLCLAFIGKRPATARGSVCRAAGESRAA
jgi:membrane-associated phospholipid phosphatase